MNNTIRKFRWFWGWEDDKEEAWLGKMARNGLHLAGVSFPSVYTFSQGQPQNNVYRLDFNPSSKREIYNFIKLFTDLGWEYLGEMAGWQYFRIEAKPGDEPEVFPDNNSKIQKFRRLVFFLLLISPILYFLSFQLLDKEMAGIWAIIKIIDLLLLSGFVYAMLKILARIKQLRKP
jgi:hypothetical protein